MEAQQTDGKDVPGRNPPHLKSRDDVAVDIAGDELRMGMDVPGGELQEVEDDESKDDRADRRSMG